MATRTLRRKSGGQAAPPLPSLGVLPRRHLTGVGPALLIIAAAVVITGVNLQIEFIGAIGWVWVAAIVLAVLVAGAGVRQFQRQGKLDRGIEAVMPLLGAQRPGRELVTVRRWTRGWVGEPARVRIRYAAHVDDSDIRAEGSRGQQRNFLVQVAENFSRRMSTEYQVLRHDRRRCLVVLEIAPPAPEVTRQHRRAEQVAKTLLGDSASVAVEVDDNDEVRRVSVEHDQGARMAIAARRLQAERVYSSMLPGRWRAQWDLERDSVVFEIRPPLPDMVRHDPEPRDCELTHAAYKAFMIPIGVDEDGRTQFWHPAVSPHCLVIGGTGSGKTSFQHTVLTHLSQAQWRVWILDGKRIEFAGFRTWPNVELVAARVEHQVRMLHAAHDLMEERYSQLENGTARLQDFEPLALIIDEYATFKARVTRWYTGVKPKGAPSKPPVLELLSDLARLARSAKIHLLLGIQRPDVEFLGGEMRDNFGARLSLGRLSPQGAVMMWDSPAVGVALPRNKRGRGVALNAESLPVEVQTYFTPDPAKLDSDDAEDWKHLEELTPPVTIYARKMIVDPETVSLDDEELEPDYYAWAAARIRAWDGAQDLEPVKEPVSVQLPSNIAVLGGRRRAASKGVRFEPTDEHDEETIDVADGADGYGETQEGTSEDLLVGDLLQSDPSLDAWVVVESVTPDVIEDDVSAIEYRDFESGEEGLITISDSEVVTFRRPTDES